MVKYRVSELARILGISDVAVRKRIKHGDFKTSQETFNKRKITYVCLNDKQISELGINKTAKNAKTETISTGIQDDEIKELISNCMEKYENFYSDYLTKINDLNKKNFSLAEENMKLKAQLSSVISKYNALAKRINASIAKKNSMV